MTADRPEKAPTPDQVVAFSQQVAEDIADDMGCPDMPTCCADCACWRDAMREERKRTARRERDAGGE